MTAVAVRHESSAVAVLDAKIANQIRDAAPQFAPFLPAGTNVEQIVAAVFLEAQRVPKLLECSPASIVSSASRLVQWGFDIGRTGYLVPFKGVCQPVPGFKGLIEMVLASGAAHACEAREVYEGDFFEYAYGSEGFLKHVPGPAGKRGKLSAFYVCWRVRFGYTKFDVMTADEVDAIRHKFSKQWNTGPLEPWYGIKTVIRRSSKQLPQNPKLAKFFAAIAADEVAELGAPVLSGGPSDTPSIPSAPSDRPAPTEPETGEAATEAQVTLLAQLANSHHFNEKAKATMLRRAGEATKAQAMQMIDAATAYIKKMDAEERAAKKATPESTEVELPGGPNDLPF